MDAKDQLLKEEIEKSAKRAKRFKSPFFNWMSSPSKSFVVTFTITMMFALFGNFLIFVLMAFFSLVYAYRLRSRSDDEVLSLLANHLTSIGKNALLFVLAVMILSFIQTSIYVSDHVPKMYSLIPQSGIVVTGFLYLITGFTNLFRLNNSLEPIYTPFSIIPMSIKFAWRFLKKHLRIVWNELVKSRN